ncbi:DPP IV N-terminal domain-containing protein [bacterium]|nr:DPP IV N-terminal domain-containing protein [bacterium]RQV92051.1 MAG: S9 family peptidase [bacterium]
MRKIILFTSFVWLLSLSISAAYSQNVLTVEGIFGSNQYAARELRNVQWSPEGDKFTYYEYESSTRKRLIKQVDLQTGEPSVLIDSDQVDVLQPESQQKRFTIPNYHPSPTGETVLLPSRGDLYLYTMKSGKTKRLTDDPEEERDPRFSPDGKKIAYLKNQNLMVLDLDSGLETPLTDQGTEDLLIGRFDWVYEEEFGIRTGFFWSSDSRSIAYFELNQSLEPVFPIVDFIPLYSRVETMRYPKAGGQNPTVRIGVVSIDDGRTTWMDIGRETDIYIPRIAWLNDSRHLAIQRLNRDQNQLDLLIADVATGESEHILTEQDPEGWIDYVENWIFLQNNQRMIWMSERSNWNHLYLYDLKGNLIRQLTGGDWDVVELIHVDEKEEAVYFIGTEKSTIERHIYKTGLDGKGLQRLTKEEGWHEIDMSPDGQHYLDTYSNIMTPPRTTLHQSNGTPIKVIESGEIEALKEITLIEPEFFTITTNDDLELNAFMIKPKNFDSQQTYPVLVYTYGGPGSQRVQNSWGINRINFHLWHELMAQKGYIIFCVDNRGTGFKGNGFQNLVYRNLGKAVIDEIQGAEYLRSLPYVDRSRIGIWGWSGGGYMTALAMIKGTEYFKVGVAVASVTDHRNYDTIWTERYMDQPEDNEDGYNDSNPITHINDYQGGLLLIHGTADDNVHLSNTMQLVYALQNARKPFDLMIYPRKLHSITGYDTQVHLFNKITDYFLDHL